MALGKPKLSTKTPDSDDVNALLVDGVHDRLIRNFDDPGLSNVAYIVARVAVDEVVTREGGARFARYSMRHIELLDDESVLLGAYRGRTNNAALPGDDSAAQLDLTGLTLDQHEAEEAAKDAEFEAANPANVTPIK